MYLLDDHLLTLLKHDFTIYFVLWTGVRAGSIYDLYQRTGIEQFDSLYFFPSHATHQRGVFGSFIFFTVHQSTSFWEQGLWLGRILHMGV